MATWFELAAPVPCCWASARVFAFSLMVVADGGVPPLTCIGQRQSGTAASGWRGYVISDEWPQATSRPLLFLAMFAAFDAAGAPECECGIIG